MLVRLRWYRPTFLMYSKNIAKCRKVNKAIDCFLDEGTMVF